MRKKRTSLSLISVTRRSRATRARVGSGLAASIGPARRNGSWIIAILGALLVLNLYVFVWNEDTSVTALAQAARNKAPVAALSTGPLTPPAAPAGASPAQIAAMPPAPTVISGEASKSDTLGRILRRSQLTAEQADEVIRALSGVLDFKKIRPGQKFEIERAPDGRVVRFELIVSKLQTVRAVRADTGELVGKSEQAETRIETTTVGGRIDSSLYAALKAAGESPALVDFFVDVFAYDLDFYNDTHDGDSFRVIVEKEYSGTEFLRYRRILAAAYDGKAGSFRTFYFAPPSGPGGYFNAVGESSEKTLLKTPLKFHRITSGFDRKRMHPVLHRVSAHLGIDYAAPTGTPVWAAQAGVVSYRAFHPGGAGNLVMIKHDGGLETAYMHLSKFADIKQGQRVAAKTVIGYVGSTGLSTGPHLHFGVKRNGQWVDPSKLTPVRSHGISKAHRDAFQTVVARFESQLGGIQIAER